MSLWLWFAAPFIGVLLGLFGAGGGMLAVPLLMYGADFPLKQAIVASLWIVAAVSLTAAVHQRAWRVVRPLLLAFFSAGGLLGGIGGAWLGAWIPALLQQLLFGGLLLIVALWTARRPSTPAAQAHAPCHCGLALLAGIGLGVLTGLLGVGGGFLMVPVLIALGISHLPTAVAHSLVLITAIASVSGLTYLGHGVSLEPKIILIVGGLAAAGSVVGGLLLKRLAVDKLKKSFGAGLALLGGGMMIHAALS